MDFWPSAFLLVLLCQGKRWSKRNSITVFTHCKLFYESINLLLLKGTKETVGFNCNLRFRILIHATNVAGTVLKIKKGKRKVIRDLIVQ